jgi:molybdopterin-guanine dinucleotide biosynthesis protein A
MLQRVVRTVATVAQTIVVVAAEEQALPLLPPSVLVARDPVRSKGPLMGLATGLGALPAGVELAYATATDVPFLEPAWIGRLSALIGDHDLAMPYCNGYYHPLAALYRCAPTLPAIKSLLLRGRPRPVFLMELVRTRIVTEPELREVDPDLATLRNLNTPEDYQAALADAGFAAPHASVSPPPLAQVSVELFGVPRLRAGVDRLTVSAANLGEALAALCRACPALLGSVVSDEGSLHPAYVVNLNGEHFTRDPSTPLQDGDAMILLAVDVGG